MTNSPTPWPRSGQTSRSGTRCGWDSTRAQIPRRVSVRQVLYADDLFSKRYASMLERIKADHSRVPNPLGEFGKVLPGPAGKVASHPIVYRPLLHMERRLTARSEDAAPHGFDATVLVNPTETTELTERSGSDRVRTLLPLLREPGQATRRRYGGVPTFVFLGGLDFPPNRDGLTWFLRNCRQEVLAAVPDFRLLLVGRGCEVRPAEAEGWGEHIRPVGWVDDLDEVLTTAAGLLSPLRIGSGIKIKVLEALARGLPVVATPHGVLGLEVGEDDGCLVGHARGTRGSAGPGGPARPERCAVDRRTSPLAAPIRPHRRRAYDDVLRLRRSARRGGGAS